MCSILMYMYEFFTLRFLREIFIIFLERVTSEKFIIQKFSRCLIMEDFLERIAPSRNWYIKPNEKSNKYESILLS